MAGKHLHQSERRQLQFTMTMAWVAGACAVVLLAGGWWLVTEGLGSDGVDVATGKENRDDSDEDPGEGKREDSTSTTSTTPPIPASERSLELLNVIGGELAPKSVVSSQHGYIIAQNMMYRHTMSVFDRSHNLVMTIPDTIEPAAFGFDYAPGATLQGAPVEAAFLPDGSAAYVSNYHMYGPGFGPEPSDSCPRMSTDNSFVYVVSMTTLAIENVIQVGTVPKYLAVSPDGSTVVVSNWCSYDVSIIDVGSATEVARVDIGRYPRGVAFTPSGETAYIAVMGGDEIVKVDVKSHTVSGSFPLSGTPRHLVMGPQGDYLYVSRNSGGDIVKVDLETEQIVASAETGSQPRSMAISGDGQALYVGNYNSNTVSKVLTDTMSETQELETGHHPIGITYDRETHQVWVANYSGTIQVFEDKAPNQPSS